jgi:hypothetical protein
MFYMRWENSCNHSPRIIRSLTAQHWAVFYKGFLMNKLYFAIGIVCAAYWVGIRLGQEKCRTEIAMMRGNEQVAIQEQIIKIKGEIYAETVTSATDVIRDKLRMQYTIGN